MKRNVMIALALLALSLSFGVSARAASTAPTSGDAATEAFFCGLSQPAISDAASAVDPLAGAKSASSTVEICGTCGQANCSNRNVGAQCFNPGSGFAWCLPPTVSTCADGRPRCQCITEYP